MVKSKTVKSIHSKLKALLPIVECFCAVLYTMLLIIIRKRPCRVVIYYHNIKQQEVRNFEKQMAYLAQKCRVVKASEIQTYNRDNKNTIVSITFDDAFLCIKENALPILRQYNLSAALSVPTGKLGQCVNSNFTEEEYCFNNENIMNEQEIQEIDKAGFEIFSHTISHGILTDLEDDLLQVELVRSKQDLERIVGHEVKGIIYPHGSCDARVLRTAEKAGYRLGFTIEPSTVVPSTNNMKIGRFAVSPTDSLLVFKLKVSGAYAVIKYLRNLKKIFLQILMWLKGLWTTR